MRTSILPALAALLVFGSSLPAIADEPVKPETFTFRVLGLFDPDREADLRAAFRQLPDFSLDTIDFDDAEMTVSFVPGQVFPGTRPDQVIERFDQKLRSVSRGTFKVRPRRTVPRDDLQTVVIPISGLDCRACSLAAYDSIAEIGGVLQATSSFRQGRITALIDPSKTDRTKLVEALRKRGVDVSEP